MAYEARRDDDLEKMRSDQNNTNNVRNAADVAMASGNPYAMAAGGVVKAADKISGGKASEALGKGITNANEKLPGGKKLQEASNKFSESGASDAVGKAASLKSGMAAKGGGGEMPNQVAHSGGGEQSSSLPSSGGEKNLPVPATGSNTTEGNVSGEGENKVKETSTGSNADQKEDDGEKAEGKGKGALSFLGKQAVTAIIIMLLPTIILFMSFLVVLSAASGVFGEYEDAFGMGGVSGEETAGIEYNPSSAEQKDFFERVNIIKYEYQAEGKNIDSIKVVAVFHILDNHDADVNYKKITDSDIREVMDSMLLEGYYDKTTFEENLVSTIIPRYLPSLSQEKYKSISNEIFTYIKDYYDLIGKEDVDGYGGGDIGGYGSTCSTESGTCSYEVKGYAIPGKGNVTENVKISGLYVRLMQCGSAGGKSYGGSFGEPLAGEALVPFEKYILGVTYAAMGTDAPAEAFKAQAVVARSYILARHVDKGGWRTLKEENGKWILQVASCDLDQIYCDPDKGCSSDSGGQVHSGTAYNGSFKKEALSQNSSLRGYASATEGEVLTNSQGYIIYTGYSAADKNQFDALARKGTGYKQILLQVYNQGSHRYGASNVTKNTCTDANGEAKKECISSGEYAKWKQYSGPWVNVPMGNSGSTIRQIGCLATSVAIQIAKSGVPTKIDNFNPGTFVQFLNQNGGFAAGGNFVWRSAEKAAPSFKYQGRISVSGMSQSQKLAKIRELVGTNGVYVVAEVKGNTGQHWVAIDSVNGSTITMMDPGSSSTNMWQKYNWVNTSTLAYFKVS